MKARHLKMKKPVYICKPCVTVQCGFTIGRITERTNEGDRLKVLCTAKSELQKERTRRIDRKYCTQRVPVRVVQVHAGMQEGEKESTAVTTVLVVKLLASYES